jgi:conserved oligomeric Golgi complex subunit 4
VHKSEHLKRDGLTAPIAVLATHQRRFTALGALSLDSDMRDLLNYAKDRLDCLDYSSNVALMKGCPPLGRLMQIAKLLNVDDLEDVLDLISASKRKGNWDLSIEDTKSILCLRVEFESGRIQDLLRLPDDAGES